MAQRNAIWLVIPIALAAWASNAASAGPVRISFWHTGDDGLSQRLADQVENTFERSPDFALSHGQEPDTLVVTIPQNVEWKQVGRRVRALYTVEFSSTDGRKLGRSSGSCWDDRLSKCAAQILKNAKLAASKIR